MFSDYYFPHTGGGVEQVVRQLCDRLVKRGHTVMILTIRTCPSLTLETSPGLTIHRVPGLDMTKWLGIQQALSTRIFGTSIRLIRNFRPDVIHAHNLFFRTTETAAILKLFFGIPLVTTLHLGKPQGGSWMFNRIIRVYELTFGRFIVHQSDHTIAVSQAVAEHTRQISGHPPPPTVIPNGVDTVLFHPEQNPGHPAQVVLFVARMVPNKGPKTLVRAAALVLHHHPQAQFVLVGDGPLRNQLQEQVNHLGIEQAVQFLGLRHDVPDLMRQANVFVRPSTLEGMPLTILEAMASGLPVVATPVGGTPELVKDGVNGYLVPVNDHDALANSIIKLLDNPSLAEKMGQRGREMVEMDYTWDAAAEQTERVYLEEALRNR